jgi:DNA primase catalytic core
MARIPTDELERLKRETDLAALVRARGVELKRHGKDLLGLCPFHDDKEPSLVVTPSKGLWNCLGACGEGGTVVDWVMKTEGVSFRHAVELLREGLPSLAAAPTDRPVKISTVPKLPCPLDEKATDAELFDQVVDFYHETLLASPEAIAYLTKRGIADGEAIRRFRLGYANRTLGLRLPKANRRLGAELRGRLAEIGILRKSGHEHLAGSVTVPVFDEQGNVAELYGRKVNDSLRKGTAYHLYLPGPHRGVWNLSALRDSKEVILCESLIDALTFWVHGFRNVTSTYGTNGFTSEMLEAFKAYGVKAVLIAFDRDTAGNTAAGKLADRLAAEGLGCFRVLFPKGMDANEYALKVKPPGKSLELLLKKAEWMTGPTRRPGTVAKAAAKEVMNSSVIEPSGATSSLAAASSPDDVAKSQENIGSDAPPPPSPVEVDATRQGDQVVMTIGDREYRVRGLEKNLSYEQLKVVLRATRDERFYLDTVDLVSARQRTHYVKEAAKDLEMKETTLKRDLGRVHLKLEELQDEEIRRALEPEKKSATPAMTEAERNEAMGLLQDPQLLERIVSDFDRCGVVGEETNKLTGYLAAVSRKLERPLAVIIQSSSAAGKSALMEAILAFVPPEERVKYSAMTGQSLFYMGETDLKHRILAIAEEEGAERASYALKLLQSEGELTIASTGKDPASGRLVTHEYRVEGPVMIFLTTTAIDVDEELFNRCIVLTVDEDRDQTRAIHDLQRKAETLEGLLAQRDSERIVNLHRNAQRLLRPLLVANPYADRLTFLDDRTRTRRDHVKYLTLIRTIALLHQHQRPVKTTRHDGKRVDYLEVTPADIAAANHLAHEVLGRTLDELSPQTRRLLEMVHEMVTARCAELEMDQEDFRFTRKEIRQHTGWTDFQVRTHLAKLADLEYVLVHHGGRGQSFVYELLYDGKGRDGSPFLMRLLDVAELAHEYDGKNEHREADPEHRKGSNEGPTSPQRASIEHPTRAAKEEESPSEDNDLGDLEPETPQNAHQGPPRTQPSYPQQQALLAAPGE